MAGGGSIGGDSGEMGDGRAIEGFGWKNRERLHWTMRLRPRLERFGLGSWSLCLRQEVQKVWAAGTAGA